MTISLTNTLSILKRFNLKTFWILSICSILILSLLYIYQVNSLTNTSKNLSIVKDNLRNYLSITEGLELGGGVDLEMLASNLNFEKIDKVNYINLFEGSVAAR